MECVEQPDPIRQIGITNSMCEHDKEQHEQQQQQHQQHSQQQNQQEIETIKSHSLKNCKIALHMLSMPAENSE